MFNTLDNAEDLTKLKTASHALVYVCPTWSGQAVERTKVLENGIEELAAAAPDLQYTAFLVSNDTPANPFFLWVLGNLSQAVNVYPMIGCGAGAVLWVVNGRVVGFEPNVQLLGVDGIVEKTRSLFSASEPFP
jgi:hypothetical protein